MAGLTRVLTKLAKKSAKKAREAVAPSRAPAFKQTASEKAADVAKNKKAPAAPKVANARGSLTAAQRKAISDAPSPQALTTLRSKLNSDINGVKQITDTQRASRVKQLDDMVSARKTNMRDAAKSKVRNKVDTRPASLKPQSSKERQGSAIGKESAIMAAPVGTKSGMKAQRSFTDISRADTKGALKKQYQAGDITKEQYDRMIEAIDSANAAEVTKSSRGFAQRASDAKFKGFTPKSPFASGGYARKK